MRVESMSEPRRGDAYALLSSGSVIVLFTARDDDEAARMTVEYSMRTGRAVTLARALDFPDRREVRK